MNRHRGATPSIDHAFHFVALCDGNTTKQQKCLKDQNYTDCGCHLVLLHVYLSHGLGTRTPIARLAAGVGHFQLAKLTGETHSGRRLANSAFGPCKADRPDLTVCCREDRPAPDRRFRAEWSRPARTRYRG